MAKLFRYLKFVLIFALLAIIVFFSYAYFSTRNQMTGTMSLQGLQGEVSIIRDSHGIPHITAKTSDLDAFFALGFVHAQDRMWQMEFQRHVEQGSLSELFGDAALDSDKFLRTIGFYRAAENDWDTLDLRTKNIVMAYTKGINAFLITGNLPLQFKILRYKPKPWTVIDTIAWGKMIAFDITNNYMSQWINQTLLKSMSVNHINQLYLPYPSDAPTTLDNADLTQDGFISLQSYKNHKTLTHPPKSLASSYYHRSQQLNPFLYKQAGKGSNVWVIDGSLTQSGKPILANDPHLSLSMPGLWYLAELKGPTIHTIGATMPGLPIMIIGHNDHIAWGISAANTGIADLFIIPASAKIITRHEKIYIKGGTSIEYPIMQSSEGPIIDQFLTPLPNHSIHIAFKWTGLIPNDTSIRSLCDLNYANNWSAFRKALSYLFTPGLNVMFADTDGNIGYQLAGKIPFRDRTLFNNQAEFPLPAEKPYLWQDPIPFDKMPYVFNPKKHFVVNCNNKIVPDSYPYLLTRYWEAPPYRPTRVTEMISTFSIKRPISLNDVANIQLDTLSTLWLSLKPYLLNTSTQDSDSNIILHQLASWDGKTDIHSIPATLFAFWYSEMVHANNIAYYETEPLYFINRLSQKEHCQLANMNCSNFLTLTLYNSSKAILRQLGNNMKNWEWGQIHQAQFIEDGLGVVPILGAIWNRHIAAEGGGETINVAPPRFGNFSSFFGVSYRQIIDLSNFNNSRYIIPTGQSDDPFSKHHGDLMPLWQRGEYISITPFTSDDKILTLKPDFKN